MMRKKLRIKNYTNDSSPTLGLGIDYWNSLSWKPVDVSDEDLGNFNDSIFFGLEELDGNNYVEQKQKKKNQHIDSNEENGLAKEKSKSKKRKAEEAIVETQDEPISNEQPKKKKQKSKKDKSNDENKSSLSNQDGRKSYKPQDANELLQLSSTRSTWDNVSLNASLHQSLLALDFKHPTPIQSSSIPLILSDKELADIVGIAETGSGKTLVSISSTTTLYTLLPL